MAFYYFAVGMMNAALYLLRKPCLWMWLVPLLADEFAKAQQVQEIELENQKQSAYYLTRDSSEVRFDLADTVATNMQVSFGVKAGSYKTWQGKKGGGQTYEFSFQHTSLQATQPITLKTRAGDYQMATNERLFVIGYSSRTRESKKVDRNLSRFLLSAYRQEMEPEYAGNSENFVLIPVKTKVEFRKRNWINMGYGLQYLAKDNPFMGSKGLAVGFLYTWEVLHCIPIFGGPFFGPTTTDKITIPLIGLASLIFWKGVMNRWLVAQPYLRFNNTIVNSGYRMPRGMEY